MLLMLAVLVMSLHPPLYLRVWLLSRLCCAPSSWMTWALGNILAAVTLTRPDFSRLQLGIDMWASAGSPSTFHFSIEDLPYTCT